MRELHGEDVDPIEMEPVAVIEPAPAAVAWQAQRRRYGRPASQIGRSAWAAHDPRLERYRRLLWWGACGAVGLTGGVILAAVATTFIR